MKTYTLNERNTMSPEQYELFCDFIAEMTVTEDELIFDFDLDLDYLVDDITFEVMS